ncbi:hypothetical protein [Lichenifustis flavocetrariae]|uniref:Uncharacterized protein n=1 Tax=Lichenifustis flavocetrariae TaxID=2949735 RepID=A0AA41Z577_9HYPH|nr:hypothetical protein [Lichenifustis flavocetrariae]MCW6513183.1 hypothetical protein [Lichenifustis flavocetrariae]
MHLVPIEAGGDGVARGEAIVLDQAWVLSIQRARLNYGFSPSSAGAVVPPDGAAFAEATLAASTAARAAVLLGQAVEFPIR